MVHDNYKKMSDDELFDLSEKGDDEAQFWLTWKNTSSRYPGAKRCSKYTADVYYYGSAEIGNR